MLASLYKDKSRTKLETAHNLEAVVGRDKDQLVNHHDFFVYRVYQKK